MGLVTVIARLLAIAALVLMVVVVFNVDCIPSKLPGTDSCCNDLKKLLKEDSNNLEKLSEENRNNLNEKLRALKNEISKDNLNEQGSKVPDTLSKPIDTICCNSIANEHSVTIPGGATKKLGELANGDKVLTNNNFKKVVGNIHEGCTYSTLTIRTENKTYVKLMDDHLVKTIYGFKRACKIEINDTLVTRYGVTQVANITKGSSCVTLPLTSSGTIVVNDIVLSCYVTKFSHTFVNTVYLPVRLGVNRLDGYRKMLGNSLCKRIIMFIGEHFL